MAVCTSRKGLLHWVHCRFNQEVGFTGISDSIDGDYGMDQEFTFSYERICRRNYWTCNNCPFHYWRLHSIPSDQSARGGDRILIWQMTQPKSSPAPKDDLDVGKFYLPINQVHYLKSIFCQKKPNLLLITGDYENCYLPIMKCQKIRLVQSELAVGMVLTF